MSTINNALESGELVCVESIKVGEFVRRATKCRDCSGTGESEDGCCAGCAGLGLVANAKTYKREGFNRFAKKYSLVDCDDFCREVFVKKGTKLFVGFSY